MERTFFEQSFHDNWLERLIEHNGYWRHDGNINRPYALLSGGRISNVYANCSVLTKKPGLLWPIARHLFELLPELPQVHAFVGSAYGAITLPYELARQHGNAEAWFTAKGPGDTMKLDRFEFTAPNQHVMMVEDVITSFKTTRHSIKALREQAGDYDIRISPYVLAIVNRSGMAEIDGYRIVSLIDFGTTAPMWERGKNPFLPDGEERLEPVKPKEHWKMLTESM